MFHWTQKGSSFIGKIHYSDFFFLRYSDELLLCWCTNVCLFVSTNTGGWNRFTELERDICTSFSYLWYLCCACCFVNGSCVDNSNEMCFSIHLSENLIAFIKEHFWLLCILFTGFLLIWKTEARKSLSQDII